MWIELFLFGTFWFWALVAVEVICLISFAVSERRPAESVLAVVLFLVALQLFSDVNPVLYVWQNPVTILLGVLVYLLGGCLWVIPKWWLFCKDYYRNYVTKRERFLLENNLSVEEEMPDTLKEKWREVYTGSRYAPKVVSVAPSPRDYKDRIMSWMILWPLSLCWTIVNDPVVRFFQWVYEEISGVLRRISESVFKGVHKDFTENESVRE